MDKCIFCKIINKEIPAEVVYEDDKILAFRDIDPKAPVHVLVITKMHIPSISGYAGETRGIFDNVFSAIQKIAEKEGVAQDGYRVVVNNGKAAGQAVEHIHFHILGKRKLSWPPG